MDLKRNSDDKDHLKDEKRDDTMRWTMWEMACTRIAQTVVALALMLAASPAVEFVAFGLKWT